MKRIIIVLSVLLTICVVGAVVAPSFFDWNSYKPQIREQVKAKLGFELSIDGDIKLSVLPAPHVILSNVKLGRSDLATNADPILSFERFDLYMDLVPLLSGKFVLSSASLIKPVFSLKETQEGKYNFLSPEIETLTKGDDAEKHEKSSSSASVQIDHLSIKGGELVFEDAVGKKTEIHNINLEVNASDILGPFEVQGDSNFEGKKVKLDASVAKIEQGTSQISLKTKVQILPENLELAYSGALTWKDGIVLQGETNLGLADISSLLQEKNPKLKLKNVSATAIVTANKNQVELKNLEILLGKDKFSGVLNFQNAPFAVSGTLKTNNKIELASLYGSLKDFGNAELDIKFASDGKKITFTKSALAIADIPLNIDASIQVAEDSGKRSKVSIALDAPDLDLTKFSQSKTQKSGSTEDKTAVVDNALKALILPFDLDLSFKAKSLKYESYALSNASGALKLNKDSFMVENLSIGNFLGASVAGQASIVGLGANDHIKTSIKVDAKNTKEFLQALSVDAASLPKQITSSAIVLNYQGSKTEGNLTIDVSALNGKAIMRGNVKNILGSPELNDLDFELVHPDMRQVVSLLSGSEFSDPNFSRTISFKSQIKQTGKIYAIDNIDANLSGASLQGQAQINLENSKPHLSGDLQFGKLAFDVSGVPQSRGSKKSVPSSAGGGNQWSTKEFDLSFLNKVNFNLKIEASRIDYGTWPLISPNLHASLQNGELNISQLQAGVFDGQVDFSAKVQSADQPRQPLHIQGNGSFKDVSLERLSSTLMGNNFVKVSGKVDGKTELKTSGLSPAALIYDLSGQGVLNGQNLVLEGVDVVRFARVLSEESRPGDTVLGIWKGSTGGGSTQFDTLDGQYVISEGVVNIQKMDLDGQKAQIQTAGTVDLPNWLLSTKHKIIVKPENADVPSDIPPFEVSFSGSLDNPTQTFGQGLLNDYLQRKLQRKLNGIISDKLGLPQANDSTLPHDAAQEQNAQEQQQEQQPLDPEDAAKEAIKDALKGFLQ